VAKAAPELYKPAEACKMAEVAPYVLRYWETEFPALAESKEKGGGKFYSGRDVRIISRIRELLYDEGFTVAGAKKRLESEISEGRFDEGLSAAPPPAQQKKSARIAAVASPRGSCGPPGPTTRPSVRRRDRLARARTKGRPG
jgi:DNA-binding transcriptional MerR regulator